MNPSEQSANSEYLEAKSAALQDIGYTMGSSIRDGIKGSLMGAGIGATLTSTLLLLRNQSSLNSPTLYKILGAGLLVGGFFGFVQGMSSVWSENPDMKIRSDQLKSAAQNLKDTPSLSTPTKGHVDKLNSQRTVANIKPLER